ncbi:hypothetical protein Hanom_Chr07g00649081 [Helianthus anomalus]
MQVEQLLEPLKVLTLKSVLGLEDMLRSWIPRSGDLVESSEVGLFSLLIIMG